jgi:MoaA/NifB/PqqE/SkfB family radical SAM enzyme
MSVNIARSVDLKFNALTHRLRRVPVIVLMPHSRCNCRCVMCDIWKANRNGTSITDAQLSGLLEDFRDLGVEWILLSGGEPLMHPNLWSLCGALKALPARITLLSTGLLLARHAAEIVRHCDEVIVSLDGSRDVHDRIRGVPNAFQQLADGIAALRTQNPRFPVSARCVVQRLNYHDLPNIVAASRELCLDRISFLAADVSSEAFNRPGGWSDDRASEVCLTAEDAERFAAVIEAMIVSHAAEFSSGLIAETPARMRDLAAFYFAANGAGEFPQVTCNAPWVSSVIEADGTVRPCFFHRPIGNIRERTIAHILNAPDAISFRRSLDVRSDPTCRRCVCTLNMS